MIVVDWSSSSTGPLLFVFTILFLDDYCWITRIQGGVTANSAIIVFLVYLYSYDKFCSILFSYLLFLVLHCLVHVVVARWRFALPYYS